MTTTEGAPARSATPASEPAPEAAAPSVGVIGLGVMGAGLAQRLLACGVPVSVWNRSPERVEALALGEGMGLDRQLVIEAITSAPGLASPVLAFKARRLRTQDYTGPDFRLRLMSKDLQLALAAAAEAEVELPLVRAAAQTHDRAVALGLGDQDCAAIAQAVTGDRIVRAGPVDVR